MTNSKVLNLDSAYSIWIMDFLWNGYGFRILKNMDYGMDMDLVLNPSGPTGYIVINNHRYKF